MNWTPTDTGQLLLLGMALIGAYCLVRGMLISNRLKKEKGL